MIFRHFGIRDFVITRGVGDEYGVGNEFRWHGPDGSEVLVAVMTAGYGYGTYPFKDGTFFNETAADYNRRKIRPLIEHLLKKSSLPGEFVLPLGFDQNPAIPDLPKKFSEYNAEQAVIDTFTRIHLERVSRKSPETRKADIVITGRNCISRPNFTDPPFGFFGPS
jgi:mannosylglycerate hydrolase